MDKSQTPKETTPTVHRMGSLHREFLLPRRISTKEQINYLLTIENLDKRHRSSIPNQPDCHPAEKLMIHDDSNDTKAQEIIEPDIITSMEPTAPEIQIEPVIQPLLPKEPPVVQHTEHERTEPATKRKREPTPANKKPTPPHRDPTFEDRLEILYCMHYIIKQIRGSTPLRKTNRPDRTELQT